MMRYLFLLTTTLAFAACAPVEAPTTGDTASDTSVTDQGYHAALHRLEERSGGRLGVVLLDSDGDTLIDFRSDQRFAFCSAFKLALAGAALDADAQGRIDLDRAVTYRRAEFPGYQPVLEQRLTGEAGTISLGEALDATVTTSDNMAANLLIDALGGPRGVTAIWRGWGDDVTRLDRREIALNQNAEDDPRDTSTPEAMARTTRMLIDGDILGSDDADRLARLTHKATTGLDRVRAGLPEGWSAGDKTGTCKPSGMPDPGANDIGWFRGPEGDLYWFAVMLDRYEGDVGDANAIHAQVGRIFAGAVR